MRWSVCIRGWRESYRARWCDSPRCACVIIVEVTSECCVARSWPVNIDMSRQTRLNSFGSSRVFSPYQTLHSSRRFKGSVLFIHFTKRQLLVTRYNILRPKAFISFDYIRWTLSSFVHTLNRLPTNQNTKPKRHHSVTKLMFVIIGGTYPASMIHGVMNFEKPYPQTFLLTVMETKMLPATGLYESMAYVEAIDGSAATWMPVQAQPMITMT